MQYETLIAEIDEGIGIITLNRPKVLNALNDIACEELFETILNFEKNDSVRVVIITGGEKVFAAGADIGQMASAKPVDFLGDQILYRALNAIENLSKPVIAAVSGFALGGGCELALVADVRVASDNAQFGLPEITLGIIPGAGGTQRLPRLIGTARAKELIFSGDYITAEEALRVGLVNKVVAAEQLLDEAKKLANRFARHGAMALGLAKSCINEGIQMDLKGGLQYENKCFSILFSTEDQKEGMKAFLEKRRPKYQGR
ncbi:MAG: enoyl-CoA hydratase-related protein [Clostridia bacterium]|nr:enoyl-CoA hydratase-related protein [Clostridia bacterium]